MILKINVWGIILLLCFTFSIAPGGNVMAGETSETGKSQEEGALDAENFSATLTLTSDYVYRGISFTDGEPAVQGSFDYAHPSGAYLGVWATNWEDSEATGSNIEIDYYLGYYGEWNALSYDVSFYYYAYPDAIDEGAEYDNIEFIADLKYSFDTTLSPVIGTQYAYSPDYSGEDGNANYIKGTLDLTLPLNLTMSFEYGYQDIQGVNTTGSGSGLDDGDGYNYKHWRIGLATELKGFVLDLSYHDTDESDWLSDNIGQADDRIAFTVSRTL